MKTAVDQIKDYLKSLSRDGLINIWNEYALEVRASEDVIYRLRDDESVDLYFEGMTPAGILQALRVGEVNLRDEYFKTDGYGWPLSFPVEQLAAYVDIDAVAEYCIENETGFGLVTLEDIVQQALDSIDDPGIEEER